MYVIQGLRINKFVDVPIRSASEIWNSWRGNLSPDMPESMCTGEVNLPSMVRTKLQAISDGAKYDSQLQENADLPE